MTTTAMCVLSVLSCAVLLALDCFAWGRAKWYYREERRLYDQWEANCKELGITVVEHREPDI